MTLPDLSKSTRTASALYDADYDDAYVYNALLQKGCTHKEAIWCMRSAELENVEHRKKKSRNVAIALGILWALVFGIVLFAGGGWSDLEQMDHWISPRHVAVGFGIFALAAGNYIWSAVQVARVRRKLPATPAEIADTDMRA